MHAVVCVFLCVQALLHTDTHTLPVSSCLVDCDRKYSPTCSSSLSKMQSCRCRAEYLAGYLPLLSFSPLPSFHSLLFVPPLRFVTAPSVSLPIPFGLPFVTTFSPLVQYIFTWFFSLSGSLLPLFPPFSYFCHSVFWLHSLIRCFLSLLFSLYSVFLQCCLLHCIVSSPSYPSCLSLIPLSCLLTLLSFHLLPSLFGLFYFLSGNILKYMFFHLSFIFNLFSSILYSLVSSPFLPWFFLILIYFSTSCSLFLLMFHLCVSTRLLFIIPSCRPFMLFCPLLLLFISSYFSFGSFHPCFYSFLFLSPVHSSLLLWMLATYSITLELITCLKCDTEGRMATYFQKEI